MFEVISVHVDALYSWMDLAQTFAKVTDVVWELQMCTAEGGGEEADRLLEGRVEARDPSEHRVYQKLCRGWPEGYTKFSWS